MFYLLRQVVNTLATPLVLALVMAIAAAVFRWRGRPRPARWLGITAIAVAYLSSIEVVAFALLHPLERVHPSLHEEETPPGIGFIVVLGSSYVPRDEVPVTAALDPDGLVRIVEGIRLSRLFPSARLVVSGGAPEGSAPTAVGYAELARSLGVDAGSLVLVSAPLNTKEESIAIAPVVGKSPFILVTSAYHMPRAILLMKRAGLHPLAAPTGQRADRMILRVRSVVPGAAALASTERALHEYLGLTLLTVMP